MGLKQGNRDTIHDGLEIIDRLAAGQAVDHSEASTLRSLIMELADYRSEDDNPGFGFTGAMVLFRDYVENGSPTVNAQVMFHPALPSDGGETAAQSMAVKALVGLSVEAKGVAIKEEGEE